MFRKFVLFILVLGIIFMVLGLFTGHRTVVYSSGYHHRPRHTTIIHHSSGYYHRPRASVHLHVGGGYHRTSVFSSRSSFRSGGFFGGK